MEEENKNLKEMNNSLVKELQYWKMTASQKDNEKLDLMKEITDLRLKLGRLRSGGAEKAHALDAAIQAATEEALSHLVQASSAMARTVEVTKTYMRDREEVEETSARWSKISSASRTDNVNRVRPLLVGGRSIQPVVLLRQQPDLNLSSRVATPTGNVTERALPLHLLQDLYIPLQRLNSAEYARASGAPEPDVDSEMEGEAAEAEMDMHDAALNESDETISNEVSSRITGEFEDTHTLTTVDEEGDVDSDIATPNRSRSASGNPLEGPSWLLDSESTQSSRSRSRVSHEPDSTTEVEEGAASSRASRIQPASLASTPSPAVVKSKPLPALENQENASEGACSVYTPTVRRRKRAVSPPALVSPRRPSRSNNHWSGGERVLKVLLKKMRIGEEAGASSSGSEASGASPPKRAAHFLEAPSPNGATDTALIVMEERTDSSSVRSQDSDSGEGSGSGSGDTRPSATDSDSERGGRTRRPRKQITYKEKPLNSKMRR